jgi:hypothetical protein
MSKAGSRILTSARQALAYATGEADTSQHGVHIPEHLDVRAIRQKIRLSQEEFAQHFGVKWCLIGSQRLSIGPYACNGVCEDLCSTPHVT